MSECSCCAEPKMNMMEGDSWPLLFQINVDGEPININDVELIEFTVDGLSKNYPGTVSYDETAKVFSFPLSQEETFKFRNQVTAQGRVKFSSGEVAGVSFGKIYIDRSQSKAVI